MNRALNRAYRLSLAALAAGSCLSGVARADAPGAPADVIVTATRLPQPLATAPDAHIVDAQEIEARQITFAADALAALPGLSVSSGGQFGLTSVSIRGASTDKTLVLIDGVPVNDASQPEGSFDFAGLDLADVARIEVLSGPQASLWGSNAIGGVVSFTTVEPNGVRLDAEGGSFGTTRFSGAIGRSTDRWALGLTASDFGSTGISAADKRNNYAAYVDPTHLLHATEPDGYRDVTLGAHGRIKVVDAVEFDGQIRYTKSHTALDGYVCTPPVECANFGGTYVFADTNDVANSTSTLGFVRAKIAVPFDIHNELSFSDAHIERGDNGDSIGAFGYTADRQVYRWTASRGAPDDLLSVEGGVEQDNDHASVSSGQRITLENAAAFAVASWRPLAALTTTASVRYDKAQHYAGVTTGRIAGDVKVGAGFSLSASAGQGFKTPTISETVCDFCYTTPVVLHPEHAESYDASLGWRSSDGRISARATGFSLNVRDQLEYVNGHYVNIQRTRSKGVELEAEAALAAGFRLKFAYGYTDAVNIDPGVQSGRELRIPLNSGSAALFWSHGPIDASVTVRSESDQADTGLDFSPVTRPGFTVANLAGGYALNDHVRLTARVENLADAHYEQEFGYGEPGRAVYVGIHFKD